MPVGITGLWVIAVSYALTVPDLTFVQNAATPKFTLLRATMLEPIRRILPVYPTDSDEADTFGITSHGHRDRVLY